MKDTQEKKKKRVQKNTRNDRIDSRSRGWSRLGRGYRLTILQNYEKMVSMSDSVGG